MKMNAKLLSLISVLCFVSLVSCSTFTPVFYDISLDFSKFSASDRTFNGVASVYFNVTQKTYGHQKIIFDYELLNVYYASVLDANTGKNITIVNRGHKENKYFVEVRIDDDVSEIIATLGYSGQVGQAGDDGVYMTADERIVGTNSYPLGVRRIFPCVNDPAIRTSFQFNVKLINSSWGIHHMTDGSQSPYLPVHAVGFIMTLHYRKVNDVSTDRFNVWVPSSNQPLYDSVNNNKILKGILAKGTYFYNFFDDSLLDKIHIVMVPGIKLLSIVNYRLISLRPDVMMTTSEQTGEMMKASAVATINALSKHFFRCVVSPATWQDFWISDSLALYLQYALLNQQVFNDIDFPDLFTVEVQRPAMRGSSMEVNPKSVDPSILTSNEVYPPVYQGATLLKMLEPLSSEDEITQDLLNYYKQFSYQSVGTQTFLDFMSSGSIKPQLDSYGKRLSLILDNWIHKTGYPTLSVNLNNDGFAVTQEVYGTPGKASNWLIPFAYKDESNNSGTLNWLSGKSAESYKDSNVKKWILLNKQSKGMFRVNYGDIVKELVQETVYWNLTGVERAALLDDVCRLSWKQQANFGYALSLFLKLENETDYSAYSTAFTYINKLRHLAYQKGMGNKYENKISEIIADLYSNVEWYKEKSINITRSLWTRSVVESACDFSVQQCQSTARSIAQSKVLGDLLPTVRCYEVKSADQNRWKDYFTKYYKKDDTQYARADALYALACPPNLGENGSIAITEYLKTINSDDILKEDALRAFSYIYSRPEHMSQVVNFIRDTYVVLLTRFKEDFMVSLISDISTHLLPDHYNDILNTIKSYTKKNSAVFNAITKAQLNMATRLSFYNSNYNQIVNWLNINSTTYKPLPPSFTTPPSSKTTRKKNSATNFTSNGILIVIMTMGLQIILRNF